MHSTNGIPKKRKGMTDKMACKHFLRIWGKRLLSLYRLFTLASITLIILYPMLNMVSLAFRPIDQMTDPMVVWIPKSLTMDNMAKAITGMNFSKAVANTTFMTLVSSLLSVVSCSIAGYGFARFSFKGRELFFALVLLTIIVPPQITIIPRYLQFWRFDFFGLGSLWEALTGMKGTVNLLSSFWTMFIPAAFGQGIRGGLFIYLFRQQFRGMPKELEDAAYIDGCGHIRTFIQVMVPNALTTYLTVFIFAIVWYWNDYQNVGVLLGGVPMISTNLMSITSRLTAVYKNSGLANMDSNPYTLSASLQSACLISIVPLLVMYLCLQRYFTESIERTGIVG